MEHGEGAEENDDEAMASSPLLWGAARLQDTFDFHGGSGSRLVDKLSYKNAMVRIQAAAETMALHQEETLRQLCCSVNEQAGANVWTQVAFIERVAYDETPLVLRVYHDADTAEKQKAKVWVVEKEWLVILKKHGAVNIDGKSRFLILRGSFSPEVRSSVRGTGENINEVLRSCMQIPIDMLKGWPACVRICETDEAGANSRCEALVMRERDANGCHTWSHFGSVCLAHKLHTCASKTWTLCNSTLSPIIHCCLHLRLSGSIQKMRDVVPRLVQSELNILRNVYLPLEDQRYRERLLHLCLPPPTKPKKRGIVLALAELLNGRWDEASPLTHLCREGCCSCREETEMKVVWVLQKALGALNPGVFSKNNWAEWADSLHLWLLGTAMHDWVGKLFALAFSNTSQEHNADAANQGLLWAAEDHPNAPLEQQGRDRYEQERLERAHSLRVALNFLTRPRLPEIFLLRVSLEPERQLMSSLLHSVGREAELHEMHKVSEMGQRDYRVLKWLAARELNEFFALTLLQVHEAKLWSASAETEEMRSTLLRVCCAPAAGVWQLIALKVQNCPYRVFGLLEEEGASDLAASLLRLPRCLLVLGQLHSSVPEATFQCGGTALP